MKIIKVLVIFLLLGLGIFYLLSTNKNSSQERSNWKSYSVDEIGLTFKAPNDLTFSKTADNSTVTFFLQKGSMQKNNYYQLYGIYNGDAVATQQDLKNVEQSLDSKTIKKITVGGYGAVEGQIKGERNRFVTYILKGDRLLTLFTAQPTQENKLLSDSIIATFSFRTIVSPTLFSDTQSAIQAFLAKKYNKPIAEVKITVEKEVMGFASGSVLFGQGGPGEGGMWLAVLGNGWDVVWDGNGNVDCDKMRQDYGFPDTILKPNFCE